MDAREFVKNLRLEDTSYQHKGGPLTWKGENGAKRNEGHTDCSSFIDALLRHSYGLTPDDLKAWLGRRRPLAITYFRAIGRQGGFQHITLVKDVQAGDLIAYKLPPGSKNTGHVMLVAGTPRLMKAVEPLVDNTEQWKVPIIDSTRRGHGEADSRRKPDGTFSTGIGQGVFRLYATSKGTVAGWSSSTSLKATYYDRETRPLAIGRLDPKFKP